jgi:hypothetical protein
MTGFDVTGSFNEKLRVVAWAEAENDGKKYCYSTCPSTA